MPLVAVMLAPPPLALFEMIGSSEVVVVFLLVLVLFGGDKMPEFARGLAKIIREFRKAASGVENEFKRALEEEPPRPAQPTYSPPPANSILPPNASATPPPPAGPPNVVPATDPVDAPPPHPDLPDDHHGR